MLGILESYREVLLFKPSDIKQHMHILSSEGSVVGMVDKLEGGTHDIKLARDQEMQVHHWIPIAWVKKVASKGAHVSQDAETVRGEWAGNPPVMAA